MSVWRLLFLNLRYHLRAHWATIASMAVATAALTGALLIGDSIRGSLRQMTLDRLGSADYALVSQTLVRDALADDIAGAEGFRNHFAQAAPAMLLPGSVETAEGAFTRGVQVIGVDDRFWKFHGVQNSPGSANPRGAILNTELSRVLDLGVGDSLIARFDRADPIPAGAVAGRKTERIESLRLQVSGILPDRGLGRFALHGGQQTPLNLFVPLSTLQRQLDLEGRANVILVSSRDPVHESSPDASAKLAPILAAVAQTSDMGVRLRLNESPAYVSVESERMILSAEEAASIMDAATTLGLNFEPTLTYLANTIRLGDNEIPYSTIAALNTDSLAPLGPLRLTDDYAAPRLKDNEILLNEWAATRLNAKVGDLLKFTYYMDAPGGRLEVVESEDFVVTGTVAMAGPGADSGLTPEYPGIHDARSMRDWDPPFPVDLSRIGETDEAYWDEFKAAPKAFVALETGRRLWRNRWGELTSIRVAPSPSDPPQVTASMLGEVLRTRLQPEKSGLVFSAVKQPALAASQGATDFSGLFIGFSLFIILSAMILIRLFFTLTVERRAREIGILLASGFTHGQVRRLFLMEGVVLSVVGAGFGTFGGTLYARLMLHGLTTWWREAVGTGFLEFHLTERSLQLGFGIGVIAALTSLWFAARSIAQAHAARLLAGGSSALLGGSPLGERRATLRGILAACLTLAAVLLAVFARTRPPQTQAALFFGVGGCALVGLLLWMSWWLRMRDRLSWVRPGLFALENLGRQNAARNRGRSMMTMGLVASASFVIVAVAANRHDERNSKNEIDSGTGGFSLMAESDAPLYVDPNSQDSRLDLGFQPADERILNRVKFYSLRLNPGEDASCLNLYRPTRPRLLGAPEEFIQRGGFAFQASLAETETEKNNPWLLLREDLGVEIVPAIADFNTAMWILHTGLGGDIIYSDEFGQSFRLRLVGLLRRSALQGEIVISEAQFEKRFPSREGTNFFFIEAPPDHADEARQIIESTLREHGLDAYPPQERIQSFLAVENTYLMTFLAVGGVGLLLGTIGLAVVMLRNLVERRAEIALLKAFGYTDGAIARVVMAESMMLLMSGLVIGAGSALVAVAPRVVAEAEEIPWRSLGTVLAAVFVVGVCSGILAVVAAVRTRWLDALRAA